MRFATYVMLVVFLRLRLRLRLVDIILSLGRQVACRHPDVDTIALITQSQLFSSLSRQILVTCPRSTDSHAWLKGSSLRRGEKLRNRALVFTFGFHCVWDVVPALVDGFVVATSIVYKG
jgi:hypothetical protein